MELLQSCIKPVEQMIRFKMVEKGEKYFMELVS